MAASVRQNIAVMKDFSGRKTKVLQDVELRTALDELSEASRAHGLSPEDIVEVFFLGWILAVFDYIEDVHHVHCLYEIIMQYLQHDGMRPYACSLLVLLTRIDDVVLCNVQRLLRLRSTVGNDPHLNRLLSVYKFHCPHLSIIGTRPFNLTTIPKNVRKTWTDYIVAVQARTGLAACKDVETFRSSRLHGIAETVSPDTSASKRRRLCKSVPSVEDDIGPLAPFQGTLPEKRPIYLQEILSFDKLLLNLLRFELPQQSLTVLRYSDLHHVVSFRKDPVYLARFNWNVNATLLSGFLYSGKSADAHQIDFFLEKILEFSEYLQEGIPLLRTFFTTYLNYFWNGSEITKHIFEFLKRLRLCSVADLRCILMPIQKRFVLSDVQFKVEALFSLTALLKNFTGVEWRRFNTTENGSKRSVHLFDEEFDDFSSAPTVGYLIEFVDRLCTIGLILENGNIVLLHAALSFYETVTDVTLVRDVNCECVPPSAVIYFCYFSFDSAALSRMCSLLVRCRKVSTTIKDGGTIIEIKSRKAVEHLNRYIVDVSNGLWRRHLHVYGEDYCKAPSVFDFNDVAEDGRSLASQVLLSQDTFNVAHHPAVRNIYNDFRVSSSSESLDWDSLAILERSRAYRFIGFVEENGFPGINEFVRTFIKSGET